jgi:hypothetical protein
VVGEEKKEEEEIKEEDIEEKLKINIAAPRNSKEESKRKTVKF